MSLVSTDLDDDQSAVDHSNRSEPSSSSSSREDYRRNSNASSDDRSTNRRSRSTHLFGTISRKLRFIGNKLRSKRIDRTDSNEDYDSTTIDGRQPDPDRHLYRMYQRARARSEERPTLELANGLVPPGTLRNIDDTVNLYDNTSFNLQAQSAIGFVVRDCFFKDVMDMYEEEREQREADKQSYYEDRQQQENEQRERYGVPDALEAIAVLCALTWRP